MKQNLLRISLLLILMLFQTWISTAQVTPTPTPQDVGQIPAGKVVVDQEFVDDANKVFTEIVGLRDALQKFLVERARTEQERASADALIKGLNELLDIRKQIVLAMADLNAIYAKIIEFQNTIIDRMISRALKPKGFFQKFLDGLKEIAKALLYIAIGKAISENEECDKSLLLKFAPETIDIVFRTGNRQEGG
jgi:hypothetical protein